ncbi:hypothetical protein H0H93_003027, partial [Arthromyces matolae]
MNQTDGQGSIAILAGKLWFRNPYMISEWSLQVADNLYENTSPFDVPLLLTPHPSYSTLFLVWKLRKFYRGSETGFRVQNSAFNEHQLVACEVLTIDVHVGSLLARLRGIFVIALANFVFPLFMNVTQLVLIVRDKDYA